MNNILCHSVFDIFTMFDVLHQLELNLRSQVHVDMKQCCLILFFLRYSFSFLALLQRGAQRVRLLIVDSISSLITPILGGSGAQGIDSKSFLKNVIHYKKLLLGTCITGFWFSIS